MLDRRARRAAEGGRAAFSPLWAQEWTIVLMAYMREMDVLATRRAELRPPPRKGGQPQGSPKAEPKPKAEAKAQGGGRGGAGQRRGQQQAVQEEG